MQAPKCENKIFADITMSLKNYLWIFFKFFFFLTFCGPNNQGNTGQIMNMILVAAIVSKIL